MRTESEVKYRKPSENAAANMSQRGSLSSDLYAEISAEPGTSHALSTFKASTDVAMHAFSLNASCINSLFELCHLRLRCPPTFCLWRPSLILLQISTSECPHCFNAFLPLLLKFGSLP